jgi:hypothetical protein
MSRIHSQPNLKQIGMATINYLTQYDFLKALSITGKGPLLFRLLSKYICAPSCVWRIRFKTPGPSMGRAMANEHTYFLLTTSVFALAGAAGPKKASGITDE